MGNFSLNQVTLGVTDVDRSYQFYKDLGLLPIVRSDHYARLIAPGNEATLSIQLTERVNSTTKIYFEVEDVDKTYKDLKTAGFKFDQEPKTQRWEWRETYLTDPDGNKICIYHAGNLRLNPPWRLPESKSKHMLTKEEFSDWLEKYKSAWENKSPEDGADLFTEDAEYFETPFDSPSMGKDQITKYWTAVPESQADVKFDYEIIHVYNNTGFCKWKASFFRTTTDTDVLLDGIFEVTFDENNKGKIFKEWWHRKES